MNEEEKSPLEGIEDEKVLIAFGAKWCGPWGLLQATLDTIEASGVKVRRVDVDTHPAIADRYAVVSLPVFVASDHGKEVRRRLGAVSPQDLKEVVKVLS